MDFTLARQRLEVLAIDFPDAACAELRDRLVELLDVVRDLDEAQARMNAQLQDLQQLARTQHFDRLRDEFATRAPAEIPDWFQPVMLSQQRMIQWPYAWAELQLAAREKRS